jgi:[CysO sulfur-carrier protein]-S-L-cysteine hydrolase
MSRAPDSAALSLSAGMARRLLAHARRELPNESCALLAGDLREGRVTAMHPARNLLASPYRYDVDPADLVRIVHAIEEDGQDLVAIFHSHPTSAPAPSPADLREARYAVIHVIAGLSAGRHCLEAWWIERERALPVPLVIGAPVAPRAGALLSGRDQSKALRKKTVATSRVTGALGQ